MAQRKASVKPKTERRREKRELTIWEQEYIERRPRFEPAPWPDTVPQDSPLRQNYSLEYLMKHHDVAEAILQDYEKYIGPLPPVRIRYTKRSYYGKRKGSKSDRTKKSHKGVLDGNSGQAR